jgi:tetratricopeptide (TPR) repeat protein
VRCTSAGAGLKTGGYLLVLALGLPVTANAQAGAECAVVECARSAPADASPVMRRLWELARAAHAIKLELVESAWALARLQTPPLEPDRAAMSPRLVAMRLVLARWDQAWKQFEAALTQASRLEPDRADIRALMADAMSGNPTGAVAEWRRVVGLDTRNAAYAYRLAHALRETGRADEAKRALQQVARLRSAVPVPAAAASARREQPFERVAGFLDQAGATPLFSVGFLFLEGFQGGPEGALEMAERAVAGPPRPGDAQRARGVELWLAGDHNGAIRELRAMLEQHPGDDRAIVALAHVLRAAGRVSEAERLLQPEGGSQSALKSYRLGQLLESQARLAEAAKAYEASTVRGPVIGFDTLYQRLARVKVNQADFDGAIDAYASRITLNPNNAEAHRSLGEIYYLQGRDDEALAEFLVAVWIDPLDARAYAALGKVQVRAQRYAEAVPALQRAVALDPGRADAHYALGQAFARVGKADAARREIAQFERLDAAQREKGQRDFRIEQTRVEAGRLLAAGDLAGAIALLRGLAAEEPENPRWPRELGAAYLRARRLPEAITALEAAQSKTATVEGERLLADAYVASGRTAEARERQARYDEAMRQVRLQQLMTGEL